MKPRLLFVGLFVAFAAFRAVAAPLPHLETRGAATQLIVDGQPYLILGGEITNTASSDPDTLDAVWPNLARLNLNTVLVPVAWDWVEPVEGQFDFSLVDRLLAGARTHHLRICFLWFGSWKNGLSSFAPAWVKRDQTRFPRVRIASGRSVEILSPFSAEAERADTRAYVRFLQHVARVDAEHHTVLMIQLQNEVGVLGDSRDRSDAANAAFAAAVPAELMTYLTAHRSSLSPALAQLWSTAGGKTTGTWTEVFGDGPATDELFMAWQYGRFMGTMAASGKAVHPLPVFTNTWIVQPEDRAPGDYPSGGPQPLSLDVWKAACGEPGPTGASAIDFHAPDIYLLNFAEHVAAFHRADNPLFVPESRGNEQGVANAFYCIGAHASLGYSPFAIDRLERLAPAQPTGAASGGALETLPLARGYAVLRDLSPWILAHQARGTIAAVRLTKDAPAREIALGDHTLRFALRQNRSGAPATELGFALTFALGADEFLIAGQDVQVTFAPRTPGPAIDGIAAAETGAMRDGRWIPGRKMNGDDIVLNYHLAEAAAENQSGSGLRFGPDGPTLQRVALYRYE
ncbi:DUF5597 domain-containing protein [Opitutus terrae]|uniref:Glycoside hydrolase family 35 n=1 Tax=Opitutus terrae (strain DSM 11246 / JCM 15787 / PB90-1) TaxID=452637 RepID=B1ZRD7_OPITP|nr:DUF5597 domain-containing protein [Opitutus terrae]ACB74624.1 conserved hypothetical protein [Opitutus terrae PB90-1]